MGVRSEALYSTFMFNDVWPRGKQAWLLLELNNYKVERGGSAGTNRCFAYEVPRQGYSRIFHMQTDNNYFKMGKAPRPDPRRPQTDLDFHATVQAPQQLSALHAWDDATNFTSSQTFSC